MYRNVIYGKQFCFADSAVCILDFHDNFDEKYQRKMVVRIIRRRILQKSESMHSFSKEEKIE